MSSICAKPHGWFCYGAIYNLLDNARPEELRVIFDSRALFSWKTGKRNKCKQLQGHVTLTKKIYAY